MNRMSNICEDLYNKQMHVGMFTPMLTKIKCGTRSVELYLQYIRYIVFKILMYL